ncbi:MAG: sulfatase, partial [Maioricimonas sp. JB049]
MRRLLLLPAIALITTLTFIAPAHAADQPNFLVFVGDDMTWTDAGCFGNSEIRTPHIDQLAREGMRLTACFTPAPMCSPTRQALYTGLYPVRNGAHPNHSRIHEGIRTMPHFLGDLGYRVALTGKRHFGPNESYPFEFLGDRKDPDFEAVEQFVRDAGSDPWCLMVCSNQPHTPWNRGDAQDYPPQSLTLPPYMVDTPATRKGLSRYYAEVTYMDGELGRCLDILDESGQRDRTCVVFLSEQGSSFPHCKWTLYDTGIKAAAVVVWPGVVEPGTTSNALISYVDLLPMMIEAAGGTPSDNFDGRSFLKVLNGSQQQQRETIFAVQTTRGIIKGSEAYGIRCARDARYKYILNLNAENEFSNTISQNDNIFASWKRKAQEDPAAAELVESYIRRPEVEFYDLESDPFELNNLAANPTPAQKDRMAELRSRLDAWMAQQGDAGA